MSWMSDNEGSTLALALVTAFVIAVVAALVYKKPRSPEVSQGLIANGWYLYTRDGCGYCAQQLDALGNQYKISGNIINCSSQNRRLLPPGIPRCSDEAITGFPFWFCRKTREVRTGLQDHAQLRQMAGVPS